MSMRNKWLLWGRQWLLRRLTLNQSACMVSCSQTGEDMIIRTLLGGIDRGFYVDIGAFHPVGFSNTYHFYLRGWHGLNVDASPGVMGLFNFLRPRDINIQACVDVTPGIERDFHMFDRPALNTITGSGLQSGLNVHGARLIRTVRMVTRTVNDLLAEYVPSNQSIHLLTMDVEGLDHDLLRSLDFDRYRPQVLCFEEKALDASGRTISPTVKLLNDKGYTLAGVTPLSVIMVRAN